MNLSIHNLKERIKPFLPPPIRVVGKGLIKYYFKIVFIFFKIKSFFDFLSIKKCFPFLEDFSKEYEKLKKELEPAYKEYIKEVSSPEMTISIETAIFIYFFCKNLNPRNVLDLGSGFSSYVLRLFAKKQGGKVKVFSIDDNPYWLNKTKEFLQKHFLNVDELLLWDDFRKREKEHFDFIFYDLGDMDTRVRFLSTVMKIGNEGYIFLDDVHKRDYLREVKKEIKKSGKRFFSLYFYTKDNYQRFGALVVS